MNKLIAITLTLVFALFSANTINAQSTLTKSQTKEITKDVKKRAKELKKQGWEPLASLTTMEKSMLKYRLYLAEDEENRIPLIGIALGRNNKIGRENAVYAGITNYSNRAESQVTGKVKSLMSAQIDESKAEEIDKFGAAYKAAVNSRLRGLIKEHFVLVRTAKDGSKEYNVFMSFDEKEVREARKEAAREAAEKSSLENLSEMVDKFINEPVESLE